MESLKEILASDKTVIIDVRSPMEFMGGHVANSRNIPLQEIPEYVEELKTLNTPIVLCCASGNRSGQALNFLKQKGLTNIYNGGGWLQVNNVKNN
ncbi:MAG: rhodanese-like domain-containing protein [Bacteroidia bacterium]|nr:rhodanese-like domain-containing protein [Bacteroidia bacterium]